MPTLAFKLTPLDVMFFRDNRPYSPTDHGMGQLPTPQNLTGMLKTHLMQASGLKPSQIHALHETQPRESRHWFGQLAIRGPWLYRGGSPLVAAPADLVQTDDKTLHRLKPLKQLPPGWPAGHNPPHPLWFVGTGKTKPASGFLDGDILKTYLGGGTPETTLCADALFCWESRTGIAVDPMSLVADDGMIYSRSVLRLRQEVSFYAELDLPDSTPGLDILFPPGLTLPWGGDGHRVAVECISRYCWPGQTTLAPGQNLLTLLITPGIFTNASVWMPRELGTLISAAVPKPQPISGWDLAGDASTGPRKPGPRPTRFAVPAGAVYCWQTGKKGAPKCPATIESLCHRPADADSGWGLCLNGTWDYL